MIGWAIGLGVALLALLVYCAAQAAERMHQMAGELDALNTQVQRTAALVSQLTNTVPAAAVQAAADSLKTTNDTLEAKINQP